LIKFENSIVIRQPLGKVFTFVANFENIPLWNYYVREVRQLTDGPIETGTTYHQIRKVDEQRYYVKEYDPRKHIVVQTLPGESPAFIRDMRFEQTRHGTRIIDHWQLDLGRSNLLHMLAQGKVKNAVKENLGKLKDLLEDGAARLQDGRFVTLEL
jgi:uncharacterized membrane protein